MCMLLQTLGHQRGASINLSEVVNLDFKITETNSEDGLSCGVTLMLHHMLTLIPISPQYLSDLLQTIHTVSDALVLLCFLYLAPTSEPLGLQCGGPHPPELSHI